MKDIIKERAFLCKCPICNKLLPFEIKTVDYNGGLIKICEKHSITGEE